MIAHDREEGRWEEMKEGHMDMDMDMDRDEHKNGEAGRQNHAHMQEDHKT